MSVPKKKLLDTAWNTTTFLLTKQPEDFVDGHRVKIVIVGSGYTGVAIGIAILFKVCSKFLHLSNLSIQILFSKKRNEMFEEQRFEVISNEQKKVRKKGLKIVRIGITMLKKKIKKRKIFE